MRYNKLDLPKLKIYKKVAWLNELPANEAERVFRECSHSAMWARQMTLRRPFPMLEPLFVCAQTTWAALAASEAVDWQFVEAGLRQLLER